MVDIQTVSITIASAGVFVAAMYYVLQLRHQGKARQTDILLRIYSTLASEEFHKALTQTLSMEFKDYDDFVKKYSYRSIDSTRVLNGPELISMSTVATLYEEIGVLLRRKLIDLGLVDDLFGYNAMRLWEKLKPAVEGWRKQFHAPRSLRDFEYLYNELKKREQQQASKTA